MIPSSSLSPTPADEARLSAGPVEAGSSGRHGLRRFQPWLVFLVFTSAFVLLQFRHRDLPPYWDGTVHFLAAYQIQDNGLLPFLKTADTGHPPFQAWVLAVLGRLGVPMIFGFHLIMWVCAGILLTGVWRLGRHLGNPVVGGVSAILIGLNPCVAGQALQFNLDLPMAAFGVLAMALFAEGRFWTAGLAAALMGLTKLNGLFGILPFWVLSGWILFADPKYRTSRPLTGILWVSLFPPLALGLYLGGKYLTLHRTFDSGEYEQGRQLALITDPSHYVHEVVHSLYQVLANNGMWYVLMLGLGVLLIRLSLRSHGVSTSPDPHTKPRKCALSRNRTFALLALMLALQVLAQSTRAIATLPRYFMICYPSLVLPTLYGVWTSFPRRRIAAVLLAVGLLGSVEVIKWHPAHWFHWHGAFRDLLANPPPDTPTSHEWSLGFIDVLHQTRAVAAKLEKRWQPGQTVNGTWPFFVYLTDSRFGIVRRDHPVGWVGNPWWEQPGRTDFIVVYDWHPYSQPLSYGYPGAQGFERLSSRTSEVGSVALYRYTPPAKP